MVILKPQSNCCWTICGHPPPLQLTIPSISQLPLIVVISPRTCLPACGNHGYHLLKPGCLLLRDRTCYMRKFCFPLLHYAHAWQTPSCFIISAYVLTSDCWLDNQNKRTEVFKSVFFSLCNAVAKNNWGALCEKTRISLANFLSPHLKKVTNNPELL